MQSIHMPYSSSLPSEQLARKRVAATAIDLATAGCCAFLLFRVHWLFAAAAVVLFLLRDTGRWASPGRIIASLSTVAPGRIPCTAAQSIKRNITLLPPMLFVEIGVILFLHRHTRIGDILAGTTVVSQGHTVTAQSDTSQTEHLGSDILQLITPGDANSNSESDTAAVNEEKEAAIETVGGGENEAADDFAGQPLDTGYLTPESVTANELPAQSASQTSTESTEPVECMPPIDTVDAIDDADAVESAESVESANAIVHDQPSAEEIVRRFTSDFEIPAGVGLAPSIPAELAAKCLNIRGEVTSGALDDAYWQYVERYSPDAVSELDDAALLHRCNELSDEKSALPINVPRPPDAAARDACISYLNSWMMIINKCRDALG